MKIKTIMGTLLAFTSMSAMAQLKSCETLKSEIEAKLEAKHVASYALKEVDAKDVSGASVVGSCDGGKKRIVYSKHASTEPSQ